MPPRIFRARASGIGKLGASRVTLTGLARKLDSLRFPTGSGSFHLRFLHPGCFSGTIDQRHSGKRKARHFSGGLFVCSASLRPVRQSRSQQSQPDAGTIVQPQPAKRLEDILSVPGLLERKPVLTFPFASFGRSFPPREALFHLMSPVVSRCVEQHGEGKGPVFEVEFLAHDPTVFGAHTNVVFPPEIGKAASENVSLGEASRTAANSMTFQNRDCLAPGHA